MTLHPYRGQWPEIDGSSFVAPGAHVIGRVSIADGASVWFNAVLRADIAAISLGARSNIQDNSTIHVDLDLPAIIGADVTIGHGVILHGCTIEDEVLIGMGAVVLNGAVIGSGSIVGAHALITENKVIPPRSLVLGSPGRVIRRTTDEDLKAILENGRHYVELAAEYAAS
jgi:carbonic anhydrase/acetyltransferase-like protein (isoleucine patch superfamily)